MCRLNHLLHIFIIDKWQELIDQLLKILLVLENDFLYHLIPVFEGQDKQAEQQEEVLLDLLLHLVVERRDLHHDVLEVVLVVDEVPGKLVVTDVLVVLVPADERLQVLPLLEVILYAFLQGGVKDLVLDLKTVPFEVVAVLLPHLIEH